MPTQAAETPIINISVVTLKSSQRWKSLKQFPPPNRPGRILPMVSAPGRSILAPICLANQFHGNLPPCPTSAGSHTLFGFCRNSQTSPLLLATNITTQPISSSTNSTATPKKWPPRTSRKVHSTHDEDLPVLLDSRSMRNLAVPTVRGCTKAAADFASLNKIRHL